MLLSPNNRSLYTDALTPPAGYQMDSAVAATFSMDLATLLSVPLQLVLQTTEDQHELLRDPIALYEALQRATERVHVFAQRGRIQAPGQKHLLYGLLEPIITEVAAPRGGAFHAKLWVLRFIRTFDGDIRYRLLLPSKNLTTDRAWDVGLTLEGVVNGRHRGNGPEISQLLQRLPVLSTAKFKPGAAFDTIYEEIGRVSWDLPDGFESMKFHLLGFGGKAWRPRRNRRLAVISPFLGVRAVEMLAKTSDKPLAIISRHPALADIGGAGAFDAGYVLHDAAETEDGEDTQDDIEIGLHAKVYLYQVASQTHIALGSANATDAALIAGKNVEILAELSGPSYKIGPVRRFLDPDSDDGLGQYLVQWTAEGTQPVDAGVLAIRKRLEEGRTALISANLRLLCLQDDERWTLQLQTPSAVPMPAISHVSTWPVTVGPDKAIDASGLQRGASVALPGQAMASLTSLIAFELREGDESLSFTLNLPVSGMPANRERAILRSVVRNREGFLRYLLLLLAGLGDGADVGAIARAFSSGNLASARGELADVPLLEELVRAFSRDPKRLTKIERLVRDVTRDGDAEEILPPEFADFWQVFREAMVPR